MQYYAAMARYAFGNGKYPIALCAKLLLNFKTIIFLL